MVPRTPKIRVCMTKLWPYEVGAKNIGLQQRRNVENKRRDVAEIEHLDVATLLNDVALFGVGFGWIVSLF